MISQIPPEASSRWSSSTVIDIIHHSFISFLGESCSELTSAISLPGNAFIIIHHCLRDFLICLNQLTGSSENIKSAQHLTFSDHFIRRLIKETGRISQTTNQNDILEVITFMSI